MAWMRTGIGLRSSAMHNDTAAFLFVCGVAACFAVVELVYQRLKRSAAEKKRTKYRKPPLGE